MAEWVDGQTDGWEDGRMVDGQTDGCEVGWMGKCIDGRLRGWVNGLTDSWEDGCWMYRRMVWRMTGWVHGWAAGLVVRRSIARCRCLKMRGNLPLPLIVWAYCKNILRFEKLRSVEFVSKMK